jgi:type I restriction-modification system DNA methylase subunit
VVPLVRQAKILAMKFDAVVANPPYMGSQYFTDALKNFLRVSYPTACSDIYPAFIEKAIIFSRKSARVSMVLSKTGSSFPECLICVSLCFLDRL